MYINFIIKELKNFNFSINVGINRTINNKILAKIKNTK